VSHLVSYWLVLGEPNI